MSNPALGTVIIACITTAVCGLTIFIIDRFGRRILMMASLTGQLVSSLVIGAALVSITRNAF